MWSVPFVPGCSHVIEVSFVQAVHISGVRMWNYNRSFEDTYRGVSTYIVNNCHVLMFVPWFLLFRFFPVYFPLFRTRQLYIRACVCSNHSSCFLTFSTASGVKGFRNFSLAKVVCIFFEK